MLRWTAVAAGICLVIVTAYVFSGKEKTTTVASAELQNTETDITTYLVEELHEDDLIAFVSEEATGSESNEVVDYLMEEDLELD
jgi:hypothetical protein